MTDIKIYITPTSPQCKDLKVWLKKKKLSFAEHDLIESDKARDEVLEKSGQLSTPVIDIDGKIVVGFNEAALTEIIENVPKSS
ncbi:glutathione S-transferase N-terminal domain-containing protein [Candidatus Woesearchaeota archaeon]|nr:glutathione S-transferase N-terminal domain-containing protein [Candidatus Woesearchaeota archaeon]